MQKQLINRIKEHDKYYRFLRRSRNLFKSIPYILQSFKHQSTDSNLILGFSGKLEGWITFDIVAGADYLGNIKNLSLFKSNSMHKVYASHVLEHINCNDAKIALREIKRILRPEGEVFLAVPNILNISQLLSSENAEMVMDIVFGVNRPVKDWYPQHQYGYTREILAKIMEESGFRDIEDFEPFLKDTSQLYIDDIQVSLCLKAKKIS